MSAAALKRSSSISSRCCTTIDAGALWARIDGAHSRVDPDRSTTQTDYDYNTWRLQSGLDGKLYENQSGTLMGGVTFQYGEISTDVSSCSARVPSTPTATVLAAR
jgi:outer membrane autotransporter protein